jgi:hypothetical protein
MMTMLMMAAGGNRGGGSAAENELESALKEDIQENDPSAFHNDVLKAIVSGLELDDIKQAIRANWDTLKVHIKSTQDVEVYIQDELDDAQFAAMMDGFTELLDDEIDD